MAETELMTAKFFQQAEEERRAREEVEALEQAALAAQMPKPAPKGTSSERLAKRVSIVVGSGAAVCLVMLAIPYLASIGSGKRTSPLDWWLRLGGARSDQTFETFLRDSLANTQNQLDAISSQTPAFQFDSVNFNWQSQFQAPQTFQSSPRAKR